MISIMANIDLVQVMDVVVEFTSTPIKLIISGSIYR